MTEHESELRTVEEIILNPQDGDKIKATKWTNHIEYVSQSQKWMLYVVNEGFYSKYDAIVTPLGIEFKNSDKKYILQWEVV